MTRFYLSTVCAWLALAPNISAQDLVFPPGEDARFSWDSYEAFGAANDLAGQTLSIMGPWTGLDADLVENVIAYFSAATGAKTTYLASGTFDQDIVVSLNANTPPGLAVFPQPGLAAEMARRGFLTPLDASAGDWVRENYAAGDSWVDLATFAGPDGTENLYGIFYKVDVKSLVWFVPEAFEEAGYEVPQSMEELKALTEAIVADGGTPWCLALGSGDATGWPATDWVEDMMLRVNPPEVYDQWIANEIPFDDPQVIAAIEDYGWFARGEGFVVGGASNAVTTDFRDSPAGLFNFPPDCYMLKQATFIPTFFPEGTELGTDVDFFYFPAYAGKDLGKPVLGGGTLFSITEDSPAARAFISFLQTPIAHEVWMAQSGFLTPLKAVNADAYANETQARLGEVLLEATTFRFDGSDLMPGEVGADAFWTGMVDYTTGADAATVAAAIQSRWDQVK